MTGPRTITRRLVSLFALGILGGTGWPVALTLRAQEVSDPRRVALEEVNATPAFLVRVDVDHPDRIYRAGDSIQVSVRSERAGYLYLFYCDASQQVTCLFPNQVQRENFIPAEQTTVIPDAAALFRLRVGPPFGEEVLKAVVTSEPLATLELQTLTKGGFTPVKPQKLKAVFVEVRGAAVPAENANLGQPVAPVTRPPRAWSEHFLQIRTVGAEDTVTQPPGLAALPQVSDLIAPPAESPAQPPVTAPAATPRGKRVGVFIGVSRYQDPGIRPLRAADRDAATLAGVLQSAGRLDELVVLVNERATMANLQRLFLQGLPAATSPGDLVIIYWSGHGGRTSNLDGSEPDGYDEYLVPYDGRLEPADAMRTSMLLDKTFGRWVQSLDGRQLVVIIDACHSGGQTQGALKALTGGAPERPFRKFFCAPTWQRTKDIGQRETAVLASSRASQVSLEQPGESLSVMTHLLVEKLSRSSRPVSLQEAAEYLLREVPGYVAEHFPGTTQTPVFIDQTTPPVYLRL